MGSGNKNKRFKNLPTYSPKEEVWKSIESKLNALDESHKSTVSIKKLPDYKAPENIWKAIEIEVHKQKILKIGFVISKIAASIILLAGITYYLSFILHEKSEYNISYTVDTEQEVTRNFNENYLSKKGEFEDIIDENCSSNPDVYSREEYLELKEQLKLLKTEEKILKEQFNLYKESQIENYLIKIVNEKLRIEKYMLNMFAQN